MAGAELHTPIARLDALLAVTRLVRAGAPRAELLRAVAGAIAESLGFDTVVINLRRPGSEGLVVAEVHGSRPVVDALLGTSSRWEDWSGLLDERFARAGAYFIPAGSLDWSAGTVPTHIPFIVEDEGPDTWRADDAAFAPLVGSDGELLGVVSVDEPITGRRPDDEDLALLVAFCAHLGAALELANSAAAEAARTAALERLARTSVTAMGMLDPMDVVSETCRAVAESLGYEHVEAALVRSQRLVTRFAIGTDRRLEGLSIEALESLLRGHDSRDGCHRLAATPTQPVESLLARLSDPAGRLVGVLRAAGPLESPLTGTERRHLLRTFGNQLEAAVSSAALAAVADSEARKSAMLSASLDAILTMDSDGVVVEFNPAAERIFGRRREEVVGCDLAELIIPPGLRDAHREGLRRYIEGRSDGSAVVGRRIEVPALRADGTVFEAEIAVVRIELGGPPLLTAFLRDISERVADRAALERQRDEARFTATHDRLTGLPNREAAIEELTTRVDAIGDEDQAVLCLSVCLDDFDRITNSLGLAKGDQLLRAAGDRLVERRLPGSMVAHLGGPDYIVLAGPLAVDDALEGARAVQDSMHAPFDLEAFEVHVETAVGYDLATGTGTAAEDILRRAGVARHRACASGNRIGRYDPQLDDSRAQLAMLADLRGAVERRELEFHYQPLFAVPDRRVVGLEALLRWRRDGRLVPPGDFIGLAEASGLIVPIGEWAIDEACRQMREWLDAGHHAPVMGVNVSPYQLPRTDLAAVISAALERHRVPPDRLCIEFTESAVQTSDGTAEAVLRDVEALGVRCAIDDFGAEHSSLTRVATLPVRMIKLDRGFMRAVPQSSRAVELLRAIVRTTTAMGGVTVVEGVETQEQWDLLVEMGADVVQGFLLARPEPPEAVVRWLTG